MDRSDRPHPLGTLGYLWIAALGLNSFDAQAEPWTSDAVLSLAGLAFGALALVAALVRLRSGPHAMRVATIWFLAAFAVLKVGSATTRAVSPHRLGTATSEALAIAGCVLCLALAIRSVARALREYRDATRER